MLSDAAHTGVEAAERGQTIKKIANGEHIDSKPIVVD